jgi:hypothetical protein
LTLVGGFFITASLWAVSLFNDWSGHRIMTVIENPELPISEIPYPVVTICSTGGNIGKFVVTTLLPFRV